MTDTLRQMERVKQFRETRERMSQGSLAVATATLREAELRLEQLRRAEADEGERFGCDVSQNHAMTAAMRQAFGMDMRRQSAERQLHVVKVAEAQSELRARRIESEQMVALCKKEHEAALVEVERRSQTETVDRFLARSRWSSAKVRVRNLTVAA